MTIVQSIAIAAAVVATPMTSQAKSGASVEETLVAREKQSWDAWQKKDVAFWQRHLSDDHVEMDGPGGPQDRNFVMSGIANRTCAVTTYNLDKFTFRQLGRDAAMLVYHAAQEFACGDKRIPNVGWVTSVYQRRDGRWQNVLFEHMPEPPPKPPASKQP